MVWSELINRLTANSGLTEYQIHDLVRTCQDQYWCYHIKQKNKLRQIEQPSSQLMALQKAILLELLNFPLHPSCIAKPGMSIGDNAKLHAGAKHLLKIDIKGCYQSITRAHLHTHPITHDLWGVLQVCFYNNYLPTGAPTSPALCNLALTPVDMEVSVIASRYGYQYTRYLDDLILSTTSDQRVWDLLDKVKKILRAHRLCPHPRKCRWYSNHNDRLIVTGVNINGKISAPREIKRILRTRLYSLAKNGEPIDNVTQGYLAHVRDIDPGYYTYIKDYYERKRVHNVGSKRLGTHS